MNAHATITAPAITEEAVDVAVYQFITRAIEVAPIERKLGLFRLQARTAARALGRLRDYYADDLRGLADDLGITKAVGAVRVDEAIRVELEGVR